MTVEWIIEKGHNPGNETTFSHCDRNGKGNISSNGWEVVVVEAAPVSYDYPVVEQRAGNAGATEVREL